MDLIDQLDAFLNIGARIPELDQRKDSVKPVQHLLLLIDNIATYICDHTSTSYHREYLIFLPF